MKIKCEDEALTFRLEAEGHLLNKDSYDFTIYCEGISGLHWVEAMKDWRYARAFLKSADISVADIINFDEARDEEYCEIDGYNKIPVEFAKQIPFKGSAKKFVEGMKYAHGFFFNGQDITLSCYIKNDLCKSAPFPFSSMTKLLRKTDFRGYMELRFRDGFCTDVRFQWNYGALELYKGEIGELFNSLRQGLKPQSNLGTDISLCKRLITTDVGKQIFGLNQYNMRHLWLKAIKKVTSDSYIVKGGFLGYVTARSKDLAQATKRIKRTFSNLYYPNLYLL